MIKFAKTKPQAVVPTKRKEDAGYDLYPCLKQGQEIVIKPHDTVMIPLGIASAFSDEYVGLIQERGSTGTKGIAQRSGVIDSGYRGEWLAPITNTTTEIIRLVNRCDLTSDVFSKSVDYGMVTLTSDKAIAQVVFLPVVQEEVEEIPYKDLLEIDSERGAGRLGSSGK